MTLNEKEIASGWKLHDRTPICPVNNVSKVQLKLETVSWAIATIEGDMSGIQWSNVIAYREIKDV